MSVEYEKNNIKTNIVGRTKLTSKRYNFVISFYVKNFMPKVLKQHIKTALKLLPGVDFTIRS
jgi:hypothetical protein